MPAAVVVPVILVAGAVIGLLIGVLVQYFDVQPFIASLAGLFLARGLAFVVSLKSIRVEDPAVLWLQSTRFQARRLVHHADRHHRAAGRGGRRLRPAVHALRPHRLRDRRQRAVRAADGPERRPHQGARLRHQRSLRGLAGLVLTAYSGAGYPRNGIGTELDAIAAVVIGGTLLTGGSGYVLGSMIGVFVYGTIKTMISFLGAEQSWTRIIVGGLLLLFIVVQRVIVSRSERRSRRPEGRCVAVRAATRR